MKRLKNNDELDRREFFVVAILLVGVMALAVTPMFVHIENERFYSVISAYYQIVAMLTSAVTVAVGWIFGRQKLGKYLYGKDGEEAVGSTLVVKEPCPEQSKQDADAPDPTA